MLLQMAKQEFALGAQKPDCHQFSQQQLSSLSPCLVSHQGSASWNRLSGASPCPDPGAAASVKVGLPQGAKMCAHATSHEGRWQRRSFSWSFLITAGFPEARTVVTCKPTLGLNFSHLVAWLCLAGCEPHGAPVEPSVARVGAGWMHTSLLRLSWQRGVLFQLRDAGSGGSKGRS